MEYFERICNLRNFVHFGKLCNFVEEESAALLKNFGVLLSVFLEQSVKITKTSHYSQLEKKC